MKQINLDLCIFVPINSYQEFEFFFRFLEGILAYSLIKCKIYKSSTITLYKPF